MNLFQLIAVLRDRARFVLTVLAVIVALTLLVSIALPKRYTAYAEALVDAKSPDPITGAALDAMMRPSYMATQSDVLQSGRVARRVIRNLDLAKDPALQAEWARATQRRADFDTWLAARLRKGLAVKPSLDSNAITITYTSRDVQTAATLANAFVQAYIDITLELRTEPARQNNAFFDARSHQARDALEVAQAKLSAYQSDKGLLASEERFDVETTRLQELSSQLVAMQTQAAESGGRSAQAAEGLQEVLNHPVVAALTADLSRQRARLEELSSRLGDAHPQVREVKANIAELRRRIDTEGARVAGSVGVNNKVTQGRLAQAQSALSEQRAKVLRLKRQRDEAAVLEREVESARMAYQSVIQKLNQTGLESQTTQTNVSFLERASEQTASVSPRVMVNVLAALGLGSLLAVAAALLRELFDRRLRTVDDVTQTLDVPVLGSLPRAAHAGAAAAAVPSRMLGLGRAALRLRGPELTPPR